jgi:hypothetical protein
MNREKGVVMNKVTRMFTMTGLAVAAGLAMGVGPAVAAPAAPAAKGSAVQVQDHRFNHRERLVDFYRSPQACFRAGKVGEFRNKWDKFTCERVKRGPKRGWVALKVSSDFKSHGHHGPKSHGPKNHGHQGPQSHGHQGPQGHPGPKGHNHR